MTERPQWTKRIQTFLDTVMDDESFPHNERLMEALRDIPEPL